MRRDRGNEPVDERVEIFVGFRVVAGARSTAW
jgi:hypothetical protein